MIHYTDNRAYNSVYDAAFISITLLDQLRAKIMYQKLIFTISRQLSDVFVKSCEFRWPYIRLVYYASSAGVQLKRQELGGSWLLILK